MNVRLLGEEISFPICAAPTVGQCMLHWEGEVATARGEFAHTVYYCIRSSTSVEQTVVVHVALAI